MVDLPPPEGPTRAVMLFGRIEKLMWCSTSLILIGKGHIIELHLRLAWLRLSRDMLFPCVRELRLFQYSLNAVQGGVHHGQADASP